MSTENICVLHNVLQINLRGRKQSIQTVRGDLADLGGEAPLLIVPLDSLHMGLYYLLKIVLSQGEAVIEIAEIL